MFEACYTEQSQCYSAAKIHKYLFRHRTDAGVQSMTCTFIHSGQNLVTCFICDLMYLNELI